MHTRTTVYGKRVIAQSQLRSSSIKKNVSKIHQYEHEKNIYKMEKEKGTGNIKRKDKLLPRLPLETASIVLHV